MEYLNKLQQQHQGKFTNGAKKQQEEQDEKDKKYKAYKNKQKKEKKKLKKQLLKEEKLMSKEIQMLNDNNLSNKNNGKGNDRDNDEEEEIEYVDTDEYLLTGKYYEDFKHVFQNFTENAKKHLNKLREDYVEDNQEIDQNLEQIKKNVAQEQQLLQMKKEKKKLDPDEKMSRKQRKQQRWLKVAQLKALVKRPDLVEAWDITAPDPLLLVYLKSLKNAVPVPRHWCQKRKFLQNKRGVMKPPFKLPENIEATGIAKLRDPFTERDGQKMIKQKLKERMNPKMGKIDIDYTVLHDAFFKHLQRPKLSIHGDIYYEGKEEEVKSNQYRPGRLSEGLRAALGISDYAQPPWLINMQRYGPPPAFPYLKIIGLNYSESSSYGIINKTHMEDQARHISQPGVYATFRTEDDEDDVGPIDKSYWGELIEEEEEDDQADNNQENNNMNQDELQPDFGAELEQHQMQQQQMMMQQQKQESSGISSVISGMETPDIDLRKQKLNQVDLDKPLYKVLEQANQKTITGQNAIFPGHSYIIPQMGLDPYNNNQGMSNNNIQKK